MIDTEIKLNNINHIFPQIIVFDHGKLVELICQPVLQHDLEKR